MLPASLLLPYSLFPSPAHCLLHPAFHFSADLRCKWSCLWLCLCSCHHCADNDNDNDEADLAPHSTHSHTLLLPPCCAGCEFSFQLCKYDKWVEQSDTPPHMQRGGGEKEWEEEEVHCLTPFCETMGKCRLKTAAICGCRSLAAAHTHTLRQAHTHRQCLHTHVTWLPAAEFCNLCIIIMIIVIAPTPRHTYPHTHAPTYTTYTCTCPYVCACPAPGARALSFDKKWKRNVGKNAAKKNEEKIIKKKTENAYNINTL